MAKSQFRILLAKIFLKKNHKIEGFKKSSTPLGSLQLQQKYELPCFTFTEVMEKSSKSYIIFAGAVYASVILSTAYALVFC